MKSEGENFSVRISAGAPPVFLLGRRHDGLYRLPVNGTQWQRILEGNISHVAVDLHRTNRLAAATGTEIFVSRDGGTNWTGVADVMPHRIHNTLAFAGDRLIAGSTGNGVFWLPLSGKAEQTVRARIENRSTVAQPHAKRNTMKAKNTTNALAALALVATQTLADVAGPQLNNGSMEAGIDTPDAWSIGWVGNGNPELIRDTETFKEGAAALCLNSGPSPASCSAGNVFDLGAFLERGGSGFVLSGHLRGQGECEKCQVAVQFFDDQWAQCGWQTLASAADETEWTFFRTRVEVPAKAVKGKVLLVINGHGKAWLDAVSIE